MSLIRSIDLAVHELEMIMCERTGEECCPLRVQRGQTDDCTHPAAAAVLREGVGAMETKSISRHAHNIIGDSLCHFMR